MKIELVDNQAGAQDACCECGARNEYMVEVSGRAFPKESLFLCASCLHALRSEVQAFIVDGRHRPSGFVRRRAKEIPDHIRRQADENERIDRERAYERPA